MLARIGLGDTHHAFPIRIAHEPAVDAGEAFLLDLVGLDGNDLLAGPRAKVERDDLGRPCAKTLGHIIAGYDEILAGLVLTAHDDMAVGVACIEMIDRHPVEPGAQILLGLHHQPADHGLEIVILCAVLRRDDEAELVAVSGRAFEEGLAIDTVGFAAIEESALAFSGGAVALELAQMGSGGHAFAQLHDAALPPHPAGGSAGPGRTLAQAPTT